MSDGTNDNPAADLPSILGPRTVAAVDLLRRSGAREFQVRFTDDPQPVIWIAYARWPAGGDAAAALGPDAAVLRLCEQVLDGGRCVHCDRTTTFLPEHTDRAPLPGLCAYQWDPELSTFRRSCEGSHR